MVILRSQNKINQFIDDFNLIESLSVSGRYLAKHLLDCFHFAHTDALGGVGLDGPFGCFDLIVYLRFFGVY